MAHIDIRTVPAETLKPLEDAVRRIVREQAGVDESAVTLDARLVDDLGCGTLLELVFALEEAFHLDIPDPDPDAFVTVRDIVHYLVDRAAGARR